MGSINFKTGEYITLVIKPYEADEIAKDADFLQYVNENFFGEDPESIAAEEITFYYEADAENIESIINKYTFEFFKVEVIPGYYESLQIDIKSYFPIYFMDTAEKREALKEATKIKELMTTAAAVGFTACAPGWIPAYYNYTETLQKIKEAVKAIKDDIRTAETWRTHKRRTA